MTEDEAKTKWCPHARVDSGFAGAGVCNRYPKRNGRSMDVSREEQMLNETVLCIASQCMAWRWNERPTGWLSHATEDQRNAYKPQGFCGLAGTL